MKDFGRKGFSLQTSSPQLKVIYTSFLVFILIGLATNLGYGFFRIGLTMESVAGYYRGTDEAMEFGKEFGELLNTSHFHAYIQGIIFLILTHLYAASHGGHRMKAVIIGVAFVSCIGDILTPWFVRYAWEGFGLFMLVWWIGIFVSFMTMIVASLLTMWRPKPHRGAHS